MRSTEMVLRADEIDYNQETHDAEARGHVRFEHLISGEKLEAERAVYNLETEMGQFYVMTGSAQGKIESRPGVLASSNPFNFQARWAERLKEKYILHDGMITNCRLPKPWWTLRGPTFDVIPNDRAIAYSSVFRVRRIPIFYTPFFYKSLERLPRRSGFLTPNIGNSSRRGKLIGVGYYWAINRSYDLTYRNQYFTQRGFAHNIDFRGKPTDRSDFNAIIYGVNDRGLKLDNGERLKQGGMLFELDGHTDLGRGFQARGVVNYLSSFEFRQAFSESFNEAIFSEVQSLGFVGKHWSSFSFNTAFSRQQIFQIAQSDDNITIRKLPSFEFNMRDRQPFRKELPIWVSLESSAGFVRRNQPLYQTRQYVDRLDFAPRVMTALRWKDFSLIPAFSVRETQYGESRQGDQILGHNVRRHAREFTADLAMPSLARIFHPKGWLARLFAAQELKHVIEPSAAFRHTDGVSDFNSIIRFDEMELISNTTEAEISIVNRIYAKRQGVVSEVLSWQVWQRRYFDPDFGGAVIDGRRNVVESQALLTAYSFLDGPRHYSPIVSALRTSINPRMLLEWRADYDPQRRRIVNSSLIADARFSQYFIGAGHNQVRSNPVVSPSANQLFVRGGYGSDGRRGWNMGFNGIYDFHTATMKFATTQVSYNTDCCGLSIQYRRFSLGTRDENQFLLSFAIANIGTFGTLKKQERLF